MQEAVAPPTLPLLHLGGFELQRELGLEALERLLGANRVPVVVAATAACHGVGVRTCSDAVMHCKLQAQHLSTEGGCKAASHLKLWLKTGEGALAARQNLGSTGLFKHK